MNTEDIRSRLRRQKDIEDESRGLGEKRYHARQLPWRTEAGTADEEANLPPGKQLLKVCIEPVAAEIRAFIDAACSGKAGRRHHAVAPLLLCEPEQAAYLAVRVMVNLSVAEVALQTAAIKLAQALVDHIQMDGFRKANRVGYNGYLKAQAAKGYSRQRRAAVQKLFAEEGVEVELPQGELLAVGMKLIDIVIDATGMFSAEKFKRAKGYVYKLRITEDLQDWLDKQHARCALLEPIHLPMVVRPKRWRSPSYGGYLTPRPGNRLIKQRNRAYHDEVRNADLTNIYDAVNHIQDTPWAVNTRVLDVMEQVWDGGFSLGGLPQRHDKEVPAKPHDIETNEEARMDWKRRAATVYAENSALMSSRLALHQGLWVARKFADEPEIYFPHELDFRGRVYPIPTMGPSPQGCDWQKALLQFSEGKPLGALGYRWLCIHIANLFGVDKVSFEDRCQWVADNLEALLDSGSNPLDGGRFWTTADSPYCALAACFELSDAWASGSPFDYVSRIPVALDGSCSGLQHFSAMLRDRDGGEAVNLLPSEKPQDVYGRVGARAQEEADVTPYIDYEDRETGETVSMANPWQGGKVTRSIVKRPTMTYCYSATRFGMQDMVLQTLRETDRDNAMRGVAPYLDGADNYQAANWLSHVVYSSISSTVSAAAKAMDWLRAVAKVASEEGLPLWWTTPLGLPILQEYKRTKGSRVEVHWQGARVRLMVQQEVEEIDARSQANGVAPNFVHSLDACHLQSVALAAKRHGMAHLAFIHDSFGTHAAETETLSRLLRETFIEQYSGNVLEDFYEELKAQLGEELAERLPRPPAQGDLDLSVIADAEYAFA